MDLPTYEARRAMFKHHLPVVVNPNMENSLELLSDIDYDLVARVSSELFISVRPPLDELSFPVHQVVKKKGQSVGRNFFFFYGSFFF